MSAEEQAREWLASGRIPTVGFDQICRELIATIDAYAEREQRIVERDVQARVERLIHDSSLAHRMIERKQVARALQPLTYPTWVDKEGWQP